MDLLAFCRLLADVLFEFVDGYSVKKTVEIPQAPESLTILNLHLDPVLGGNAGHFVMIKYSLMLKSC